jgi:hypothetical protein
MTDFERTLTPKQWESFCETMLRNHHGAKYFYPVPDEDRGDLGLEFFTATGIIYQCYFPKPGTDMAVYKKSVKKKVSEDLKKLIKNGDEISTLLDGININQWVLLTPDNKSKDLIKHCNKMKKEIIGANLSFIATDDFTVKIETANSYPDSKLFAQGTYGKAINVPLSEVTDSDLNLWKLDNNEFSSNVARKTERLLGNDTSKLQAEVVTKYIQLEKFLDYLRYNYPDIYNLIEDSSLARLEDMRENALLEDNLDKTFIQRVIADNKHAFGKHAKYLSEKNEQQLSFGYLSKWLAECYMDFSKPGIE